MLDGRVAIVTGGNTGIGRAAVLALARAGARVVVAARREPEGAAVVADIEAAGEGRPSFGWTSPRRTMSSAWSRLLTNGRLDVAFNNAGADTASGTPRIGNEARDVAKLLPESLGDS